MRLINRKFSCLYCVSLKFDIQHIIVSFIRLSDYLEIPYGLLNIVFFFLKTSIQWYTI